MRKNVTGFTIIELLVVIAVIAILTTISVVSFGRYQANARDSQRASRATIITEALEKYYDQNGEYPSCGAVTSTVAIVSQNVLPGIDTDVLRTPQAATGVTNSILCQNLTNAVTDPDIFSYSGDGSATCNGSGSCLQFTLKYKSEADSTIKTINSRRNTNIATAGTTTITSTTPVDFTQISLSWNVVTNASTYTIQRATDSGFTANLATSTSATASATITGLSYSTLYYFRVAPNAPNSQGAWSPSATATTWTLAPPIGSATPNSVSQITFTWPAVTHASTYSVQLASDAGFTSILYSGPPTTSGSLVSTGLTTGTSYYFRVKAVNGAYTGNWSTTVIGITTIDPPAPYTISSTATYNTLTATANSICAPGTTPLYQWYANGSPWVNGTQYKTVGYTIGNGSSVTLTVSTTCTTSSATSSATASSNSVSLTWDAPSATIGTSAYRTIAWNGTCPSGSTSANFYWRLSGGAINASGNSATSGSYSNTGTAWGDGGANVTLTCYGPWGSVQGTGWSPYGPGCVPTVTLAQCYG